MEQFFTSLSKRQTMLLLTALAFGGSDSVESFEHLSTDEEELLKHRAAKLLQIPRDKRVPVLVQEIKRLITQRRRQLASAEPKRLATVLSKERPAMVEVVLKALPSEMADAVRADLKDVPRVKLSREVKADVLSIIRWKLEDALAAGAKQAGSFRFTDLMVLQQREVLAIADRMGARVLATAVAGLPDDTRDAWLQKLPPDQRSLAARAAEAGKSRHLNPDDAKTVLEMYGAMDTPSTGLRNAGVQRVVRACVAQGPEFAARMIERHPGDLGRMIQKWVREERNKPVKGDGGRQDIVEQMERLAQKGVIDRPMRLPPPIRPPPMKAPPLAPPPAQRQPPPRPGRGSQPLPALQRGGPGAPESTVPGRDTRRPSQNLPERGGPSPAYPGPRRPTGGSASNAPRRDPIAERNARRAGAAPSRSLGTVPRPAAGARQPSTDPAVKRIVRDGKPLERDPYETQPPKRRATAAPALQAIPRRKSHDGAEPPQPGSARRSPVVKGGRGPGRGPSGGSG